MVFQEVSCGNVEGFPRLHGIQKVAEKQAESLSHLQATVSKGTQVKGGGGLEFQTLINIL